MGRSYENRKASMAKTSDMKAKLYSRYGREIYMSAKSGSTDPTANVQLRGIIDRAKKDQVPSHVIDNAIKKAQGGTGENFSPAMYEGYGPGNVMVLVECLTDNPNRTISEVRTCFNKGKGKIGTPGTVAHMFEHLAIFVFDGDEDQVMEILLEADVDELDIETNGDKLNVFAAPSEYAKTKTALVDALGEIDFEVDEIQYFPQTTVALQGEDQDNFDKLIALLNDVDDVQNIWHNAEI
ncbi:MAG: YebC/PmpR family DNA-binding transcriptional regulator [Gammaproteobacteria bacterium]|nr:YebC/PmpR family DNA-binding transcriptional regulator [Gammaproteobacteria bacterium]